MNDVEVEISVSIGLVGCRQTTTIAFDKDEWESMDDTERDKACMETMFDMIEWNYEEVG